MKSIKDMTNAELAAFIESHLLEKGIYVVLSGGACVSIYSSNKYVSMDLDLVNVRFAKRQDIRSAIQEIGFQEEGRHFKHPDTELLIEFPPGPLAVGEEPVKKVDEHKLPTGILRIISPTDCVKDRLAGYLSLERFTVPGTGFLSRRGHQDRSGRNREMVKSRR
jgi:hypothetical protein